MKIGIIGNMNNSYFSLTRYLRDEGYDCELLVLANEPSHFDPACDTFSNDYTAYCRHVSWGDPGNFLKEDFLVVKKDIESYSFLIGNGPAPAYVAKVGRVLDLFMPYGYDIYSLPFTRFVHPRRLLAYAAVARFQRKGIKESCNVLFDRTNKFSEDIFQKLVLSGKRTISPAPMVYYKDYEKGWQASVNKDVLPAPLKKLREEADILLVQHTRQFWKWNTDYLSYKGNNFLIEGYAKFIQDYPATKIKLILFEYGIDVKATKVLIRKLGIKDAVIWMPKMPRNKLMVVLAISDMIIGELYHSWLSYGVALEALCLAKPFMHKRNNEDFSGDYPELYPMLHAFSSQSVYDGLTKSVSDKKGMKEMGEKGRQWFRNYCVNKPIAIIKAMIEEKIAFANL